MAWRTTDYEVQAILGNNWDGDTDLTPFIDMANVLVTNANACAVSRGITLSSETLVQLEKLLAAHFYTMADPLYKKRKTLDAEGEWFGEVGKALEGTSYGQNAMMLDTSGCLSTFSKGVHIQFKWLGIEPADQTPYVPYQRRRY